MRVGATRGRGQKLSLGGREGQRALEEKAWRNWDLYRVSDSEAIGAGPWHVVAPSSKVRHGTKSSIQKRDPLYGAGRINCQKQIVYGSYSRAYKLLIIVSTRLTSPKPVAPTARAKNARSTPNTRSHNIKPAR